MDSTSPYSNVNNDTNIERVDNPWKDTTENDNQSRNPGRAKSGSVNTKKLIENKTRQGDNPKSVAEKTVIVHEIDTNNLITDDESEEENPIKFAEAKKKLRTKKNNGKQSRTRQIHLNDENDESIGEDLLKQYLPQVTSTLKNVKLGAKRAYTTQNFGNHEDSQNNGDDDHDKCYRCGGMFIKGKPYTEHVDECLDRTSRDGTLETISLWYVVDTLTKILIYVCGTGTFENNQKCLLLRVLPIDVIRPLML